MNNINLRLVGFSQDVDLSNPEKVQFWLNLRDDKHGQMFRLPVQEDTTKALIHMLYSEDQFEPEAKAELEKQAAEAEALELEGKEAEDPKMGQTFSMPVGEPTGDPDLDGPDLLSAIPGRMVELEETESEDPPDDEFESEESVPSL